MKAIGESKLNERIDENSDWPPEQSKFCKTDKIDRLLMNLVSANSFFNTLFKRKQIESKLFHSKAGISQELITETHQFISRVLKDGSIPIDTFSS